LARTTALPPCRRPHRAADLGRPALLVRPRPIARHTPGVQGPVCGQGPAVGRTGVGVRDGHRRAPEAGADRSEARGRGGRVPRERRDGAERDDRLVGSVLPPRERPCSGHPPSRRPAARRVGCVGTRRLHHAVARRSAARPDPLGRERRRERPYPPRRAGLEEGACACALRAAGRAAVAFLVGAPGCRPRGQPRRRSGGPGATADRGRRVEGFSGGTRGDHPPQA
jgi:hypothetical protein